MEETEVQLLKREPTPEDDFVNGDGAELAQAKLLSIVHDLAVLQPKAEGHKFAQGPFAESITRVSAKASRTQKAVARIIKGEKPGDQMLSQLIKNIALIDGEYEEIKKFASQFWTKPKRQAKRKASDAA